MESKTAAFITLGCKINQYETVAIRREVLELGYEEVRASTPADVYVVNTCSVTAQSGAKSRKYIQRAARTNPEARIVVVGCSSDQEKESFSKIPQVALLGGNEEKPMVASFLDGCWNPGEEIPAEMRDIFELNISGFGDRTRATVKVQDGCNNYCSFCIIPFLRGLSKSRDPDAVIDEIRRLVAAGAIGEPRLVHHIAKPNAGLLNTATHTIDAWRYYLADPETLWVIGQTSRTTDRWERRSICEDLCMGLVCFAGGARGIYEGDLPGPRALMPEISGTEGKISLGAEGKLLLHQDGMAGWREIEPPPVKTDQYQEMIDWIEGRVEDHRGNAIQARYTLEIMMAIFESLRIKNVVEMPLTTRACPLDTMVEDGTLPVLQQGRYDLRVPFPEQLEQE